MDTNEMKGVTFMTTAKSDTINFTFTIGLYVFKESNYYIAYAPSFDLSSYSDTYNGTITAFHEAFQLHVEYCVARDTLMEDLRKHGREVAEFDKINTINKITLA